MKKNIFIIGIILIVLGAIIGIFLYKKTNNENNSILKLSIKKDEEVSVNKTVYLKDIIKQEIKYGSNGHFDIEIKNQGSENGLAYSITMSEFKNKPTSLRFYTDEEFNSELVFNNEQYILKGGINNSSDDTVVRTIYWKWEDFTISDDGTHVVDNSEEKIQEESATNAKELSFDIKVETKLLQKNEDTI